MCCGIGKKSEKKRKRSGRILAHKSGSMAVDLGGTGAVLAVNPCRESGTHQPDTTTGGRKKDAGTRAGVKTRGDCGVGDV